MTKDEILALPSFKADLLARKCTIEDFGKYRDILYNWNNGLHSSEEYITLDLYQFLGLTKKEYQMLINWDHEILLRKWGLK